MKLFVRIKVEVSPRLALKTTPPQLRSAIIVAAVLCALLSENCRLKSILDLLVIYGNWMAKEPDGEQGGVVAEV